jgi:cephalosporin-C deacetylase-like acetyl esterase
MNHGRKKSVKNGVSGPGLVIVTVGLVDRTCPATSVYTAYNAIPGKHQQIVVYPTMGHVVPKDWGQLINAVIKKSHIESPAEKRKKKNQGF